MANWQIFLFVFVLSQALSENQFHRKYGARSKIIADYKPKIAPNNQNAFIRARELLVNPVPKQYDSLDKTPFASSRVQEHHHHHSAYDDSRRHTSVSRRKFPKNHGPSFKQMRIFWYDIDDFVCSVACLPKVICGGYCDKDCDNYQPMPSYCTSDYGDDICDFFCMKELVCYGVCDLLCEGYYIPDDCWNGQPATTTTTTPRPAATTTSTTTPAPLTTTSTISTTTPAPSIATSTISTTTPASSTTTLTISTITPGPPVITAPPPVITSTPPVITSTPPVITAPPPVITSPPPVITSPPPVITSPPPVITSPPPVITSTPPVLTSTPPVLTSTILRKFSKTSARNPSDLKKKLLKTVKPITSEENADIEVECLTTPATTTKLRKKKRKQVAFGRKHEGKLKKKSRIN